MIQVLIFVNGQPGQPTEYYCLKNLANPISVQAGDVMSLLRGGSPEWIVQVDKVTTRLTFSRTKECSEIRMSDDETQTFMVVDDAELQQIIHVTFQQ